MNDIEKLFNLINNTVGKDMFDEFIINLLKSNLLNPEIIDDVEINFEYKLINNEYLGKYIYIRTYNEYSDNSGVSLFKDDYDNYRLEIGITFNSEKVINEWNIYFNLNLNKLQRQLKLKEIFN